MRHAVWVSCLVLVGSVSLVAGRSQSILGGGSPVKSFNIDLQNRLVVEIEGSAKVMLPDGAYESRSGTTLEFSRGRIVSIEMRGIKVPVDSVTKAGGKIMLRGASLEKINRTSEIELPGGRYMSQNPNDPKPQPDPEPTPRPQGFDVEDGAVVLLISPRSRD